MSEQHSTPIGVSSLFSIEGKVALVTGGSRGIGLMIARGFVEAGAKVYISSRKKDVCDAVAAELSEIGTCISIPADLSTNEGVNALAEAYGAHEQHLDILINNAGAAWGAPFDEYPEDGWDKVMDLNVRSIFYLTQKLMPLITAKATDADPARVINIGSIDGLQVPITETYAYTASKAAVHHLTRHMAVQLGKRKVAVNAIAPGPFVSKMTEWLLDAHGAHIVKQCPLSRIGQPDDMAGAAIFLSSRAGAYLNGTVIPVDGGIHIK